MANIKRLWLKNLNSKLLHKWLRMSIIVITNCTFWNIQPCKFPLQGTQSTILVLKNLLQVKMFRLRLWLEKIQPTVRLGGKWIWNIKKYHYYLRFSLFRLIRFSMQVTKPEKNTVKKHSASRNGAIETLMKDCQLGGFGGQWVRTSKKMLLFALFGFFSYSGVRCRE